MIPEGPLNKMVPLTEDHGGGGVGGCTGTPVSSRTNCLGLGHETMVCDVCLSIFLRHQNPRWIKKCCNKQFLSLVWVFMADNNVNNEPLVMHDSQGHF